MTRYLLYSGCAAEHDRKPVQVAAIDVARMLGLTITESGVLACCGARGQAAAEVPDASHLLDPLMAAARQGDTIVCLSPACTQALALHLSVSSQPASEQRSATVCDYVSFVLDAGALGGKLHRTLAPMKVALQAECFAGHRQQPLGPLQLVKVGGIESLSRLVEQTGASVVSAATAAGHVRRRCAGHAVQPVLCGSHTRAARPRTRASRSRAASGARGPISLARSGLCFDLSRRRWNGTSRSTGGADCFGPPHAVQWLRGRA
jgi:hypothetical protein